MDEKKTAESEAELPKVFTEAQEQRIAELIRIEIQRNHSEAFGDGDDII